MFNDEVKLTGHVCIELRGADGKLKKLINQKNQVVDAGRNYLWQCATNGVTPAKMGWMALGTNPTASTNADTALGAEVALSRTATTTNGTVTTTASAWVASFGPGVGTGALTEAGIFNASAAGTGTMLAHVVFGTLTKNATDTITITWTITLA